MDQLERISIGELETETAVTLQTLLTGINTDTNEVVNFLASALVNLVLGNISVINLPAVNWTPAVTAATNPTITGLTTSCSYVRVGDLLFVRVRVDWTNISGGSGAIRISAPPGVSLSTSDLVMPFLRGAESQSRPVLARGSGDTFQLIVQNPNAAESSLAVTQFSGAGGIQFSGAFRV